VHFSRIRISGPAEALPIFAVVDDLEASRRRIEELEHELRETRERSDAFTRIVESIDHHVYINEVLPGGGRRTLFAGPGRDKLLGGVPADGDWGRAWIEAVHPDDRARYAEHTARYLRGEMSEVRCRLIGLDGVTRWVIGGGMPRRIGGRLIVEGIVRDATAEMAAEERLREAARTDSLTGLFNRRHFSEALEAELERSRREHLTPGLLLLDVDHFKAVNDTYGHQVGDAVLAEIAARLRAAVRGYDCVARWGGEEFVVLAPALDSERVLWRICEGLRQSVGQLPITVGTRRLDVTVSLGAVLVDPISSHELIFDQADRALYAAKRLGRDRARLFSELTAHDLAAEEPEAIRLAQALSLSAGVREGVPEQHAEAVAELSGAIAAGLGLPDEIVLRCRLGGWLHDIGKVAIPDRILVKPGDLDEHEWRIMRTHAEIGEQLVRRVDGVSSAALAVRHHHEHVDGSGYPDGLAGDAIPIEARVVAVADAYCAITADRPYRRALPAADALAELRLGVGRHHDSGTVEALARALAAGIARQRAAA
jgi:diguanylate cyclase (GGDEF)-like protein